MQIGRSPPADSRLWQFGLYYAEISMKATKKKIQLIARERLELFTQRVDELYDRRLVRQGMGAQLTINWDMASQLLTQRLIQPDEEDLRSFLLLFRQFVSKNEPIFVERIFNDSVRFLESTTLKEEIEKAKKAWNDSFHKMGAFEAVIDNKELTGEYLLDLWINGHYFHNDSELAAELRRYIATNTMPLVRMQLLAVLPGLTQIIG